LSALLVLDPGSLITGTIGILLFSFALSAPILPSSLVHAPVGGERTFALKDSPLKCSFVCGAVWPDKFTLASHLVILPLAFILGPVSKNQFAMAVPFACLERAFVDIFVREN
jgi:hypothetical protein